jgi:PKHD-type hydroxylase
MRLASFFWIQSLVREDARRALLFDLDSAIRRLAQDVPDNPGIAQASRVYQNLLRQWSEP